jgi:rieske iron-sulfur protein
VNQWSDEKKAMVCSCHGSTYDPKNSATVIFGPAPMSVAGLPLKSENGVLIVTGPFDGPIGMQTN